jgi:hypothetical protein
MSLLSKLEQVKWVMLMEISDKQNFITLKVFVNTLISKGSYVYYYVMSRII